MKIVAISDIHTKQLQLNHLLKDGGDVLVVAGDLTYQGDLPSIQNFADWLDNLDQFKNIVVIAGNHDWGFQKDGQVCRKMLEDRGIIYLENQEAIIDGIKFWGSPITPWFFNWAFNIHRGPEIRKYWDMIPMDTDVLITHGPPKGHGDLVNNSYTYGENVGCEELLLAVQKVKPQVHFFGHIHEGYGVSYEGPTTLMNCSVVNARYQVTNMPMVFNLTGAKNPIPSDKGEAQ